MKSIKVLVAVFVLIGTSSVALAGQWKPLCVEGGLCKLKSKGEISSFEGLGPLFTSEGFLLTYLKIDYSDGPRYLHDSDVPHYSFDGKVVLATKDSLSGPSSFAAGTSDMSSIELPSGKKFNFYNSGLAWWHDLDGEIEYLNYSGRDFLNTRMWSNSGPPVIIDDTVYIATSYFGSRVFSSNDDAVTWTERHTALRIGETRYHLMKNPEGTALWALQSEFFDTPGGLWESTDHGEIWVQVDDGSLPPYTIRVVHDPRNLGRAYALTDYGLFVSLDRGVSWQETEFSEAIYSLLFIERATGHPRLVIIGTDTGVRMSTDEMESWTDISSGLLAEAHSVVYGDGLLIATSKSGYFGCELMDCFGAAQVMQPEEDRGLVDVVEFFHPDLNHYFITAAEEEVAAIEQGAAGPGWVRTGEQFTAWNLGGSIDGDRRQLADVCRFYGSLKPGPNSHFYTASASECKFLMDLRYLTPDGKPRWHFEGYVFTVPPAAPTSEIPCPVNAVPVYRAYNNGFDLGIHSNHRYMIDPDLVDEMVEKGWIDEGVAFCSPEN